MFEKKDQQTEKRLEHWGEKKVPEKQATRVAGRCACVSSSRDIFHAFQAENDGCRIPLSTARWDRKIHGAIEFIYKTEKQQKRNRLSKCFFVSLDV